MKLSDEIANALQELSDDQDGIQQLKQDIQAFEDSKSRLSAAYTLKNSSSSKRFHTGDARFFSSTPADEKQASQSQYDRAVKEQQQCLDRLLSNRLFENLDVALKNVSDLFFNEYQKNHPTNQKPSTGDCNAFMKEFLADVLGKSSLNVNNPLFAPSRDSREHFNDPQTLLELREYLAQRQIKSVERIRSQKQGSLSKKQYRELDSIERETLGQYKVFYATLDDEVQSIKKQQLPPDEKSIISHSIVNFTEEEEKGREKERQERTELFKSIKDNIETLTFDPSKSSANAYQKCLNNIDDLILKNQIARNKKIRNAAIAAGTIGLLDGAFILCSHAFIDFKGPDATLAPKILNFEGPKLTSLDLTTLQLAGAIAVAAFLVFAGAYLLTKPKLEAKENKNQFQSEIINDDNFLMADETEEAPLLSDKKGNSVTAAADSTPESMQNFSPDSIPSSSLTGEPIKIDGQPLTMGAPENFSVLRQTLVERPQDEDEDELFKKAGQAFRQE